MTRSADEFRSETLVAIDAVERALRDALSFLVVGEERGGEAPADGAPYWLVDPICGTRNFASGMPLYCVNLALVEEDQVTVAVVGDPSTAEMTVAERGRGAWALKDGARRKLGASGESRTIVVEDGKSTGPRRERAAQFTAGAIRADRWHVRSLGTTLALSYLAAGRISAYVLFGASAIHTRGGHPPRHRGGRNPVRYRRPAVDHPLGFGRRQRQCSSPPRATRPCPM
jgi:myo-inositol-1(or 4)-monophosphatase